jgi:anti-sigma-K factor RskA
LLLESWRRSLAPIPTRTVSALPGRDEELREGVRKMFNDWQYVLAQDRAAARSPGKPSLRARVARRLFELAVATESEETWRIVWERLEARGRL